MRSPKIWFNIALANLCIVASLGVILRTKIIFDIPWVDYNLLVDTHGNFAFNGWVTIALLSLMLFEFPGRAGTKKIYPWLLGGLVLCAYAALVTAPFKSTHKTSEYIAFAYTFFTYLFAFTFIADIRKTNVYKSVKVLAISSLIYLVLSSAGTIMLSYLFAIKSLNAILYRDALFGYLHMVYNGFFCLSVFAIAFNKVLHRGSITAHKTAYHFSVLLSATIIPSMFITFLWYDTIMAFHLISVLASILLFITFVWLIRTAIHLRHEYHALAPAIRALVVLSVSAFAIKLFLQSLTIFHTINVQVFGNRSIIMGFLHLVFLGFVTLFLVAYFAQIGMLAINKRISKIALYWFAVAVIVNELLLMMQGLGTMLSINVLVFNWFLWVAGLMLLSGTWLIALARFASRSKAA